MTYPELPPYRELIMQPDKWESWEYKHNSLYIKLAHSSQTLIIGDVTEVRGPHVFFGRHNTIITFANPYFPSETADVFDELIKAGIAKEAE